VLEVDSSGVRGYRQIRSSAWLEHYTDNVGVSSSNLLGSTKTAGGCLKTTALRKGRLRPGCGEGKVEELKSPSGGLAQLARAPALQAGGHRFDSDILHSVKSSLEVVFIYDVTMRSASVYGFVTWASANLWRQRVAL
jgi:hypothetical protein